MRGMGDGVSGRSAASGMRRAIAEVGPLGIRVRKPVPQLLPFEQSWFRPRCFLRVPKMTDRLGILHCMSVVEYVQFANWA